MTQVDTPSHSRTAVIIALMITGTLLLSLCGGFYWRSQGKHYPVSERITTGKCGSVEPYYYGRSFRVSTQQCFTTVDQRGEIAVWYQSRGYQWLNDGQVQQDQFSLGLDYFRTERVYILPLEPGQTTIRVYTDHTIRLPSLN